MRERKTHSLLEVQNETVKNDQVKHLRSFKNGRTEQLVHKESFHTAVSLDTLLVYHLHFSLSIGEQRPGSLAVPMVTCLSTPGMCKQSSLS